MTNTLAIIPPKAREKVVKRHSNGMKAVTLYYVNRKLVAHRSWNLLGNLAVEYSIRDNVKHGPFRRYHDNGAVSWATQFVRGKEHGVSRQYDENGGPIGTYRMTHGTGVDLWYTAPGELSEERYVRDGKWNGFERWWNSNQVWQETHFKDDLEHGIKRAWNDHGRLRRGYPQYFINGLRVTKRRYLRACRKDTSLPIYRKEEDNPKRTPPKLRKASYQAAGADR
jgi:antitoxin component YwqK of YwqJK toxin-antitoxin module